jgi:uncharacterized protein (DUF1697 family)
VPTHVALLRGINLGANKRVAMPALRELVESLGYDDVSTYIASGNVLFSTRKKDTGKIAAELEKGIEKELGVSCRVAVISRDELEAAARNNPFPDEKNPKAVHAVFLLEDAPPGVDALEGKDEAKVVGRVLYVHTPDGFGPSKFASKTVQKVNGTARNWATVMKLLELLSEH